MSTGQQLRPDTRFAGGQQPRHRLPPPPVRDNTPPLSATAMVPIAAGFSVVCAASALSGVLQGVTWLLYLAITIGLVVGTGILLRAMRTPVPLVGLGQVFALLCLLVMSFTRSGLLVVLPSPTALGDLLDVLHQAVVEVQTKAPPVTADEPMVCLVLVAIGLVAVLVDTLAVAAEAPAASGLVLLCVYAVPASLADEMLPWWSFVVGAGSFALLLAVDGRQRHLAWRGRRAGVSGAGVGEGSRREATGVAALAVIAALVVGGTFTMIGTVGRLPGGGSSGGGSASALGIKPFTKLSGLLQQSQGNRELFRVRGLDTASYLRALTLDDYSANDGWRIGQDINGGVKLDSDRLPGRAGAHSGQPSSIEIETVNWEDRWAPVYGTPAALSRLGPQWFYDQTAGTVNTPSAHSAGTYSETAWLQQPSADQLRADDGRSGQPVDARYTRPVAVTQRVRQLAESITSQERTTFDKAAALTKYFNGGANGFRYELSATPKDTSIDQLEDFLFNTRAGFCEQYASAMAVMLRDLGVAARVAIGFTPGVVSQADNSRTILASDAHAWVEVYFPNHGWVTFDPTPLSGGRAVTPPYLQSNQPQGGPGGLPDGTKENNPSGSPAPSSSAAPSTSAPAPATGQQGMPLRDQLALVVWLLLLVPALLLAVLCTVLARVLGGSWSGAPRWLADLAERLPTSVARRVPLVAVASWAAVLLLVVGYLLSWWLSALLLVAMLAVTPITIRELRRRARLAKVSGLGPDAAGAAWDELLAESVDRGAAVQPAETVRATARRLARDHDLDETGRQALRLVITSVEASWYGQQRTADPGLVPALAQLRATMNERAPLALRAKLLPRSVLGGR
ncbi:DUF3488 and transglutaminase-like domain-containing protein [Kutzneria viridogrisea]|uniref:Transglutaminase-like domain-containing protein n=2 Tax=Kutzneria TaxID=43356 RepID=W5WH09_9PSEU|nr:DUF3488 and transglutaminase-like domain-containing protein [Kutzneria albida]AHI00489.1 hypothetical protein KALB_7131 [Kutzneria albida DSM 43870]MBA8925668.1 transglutaminase-like putative cysteine protease [Kutzneria viridogrisea]